MAFFGKHDREGKKGSVALTETEEFDDLSAQDICNDFIMELECVNNTTESKRQTRLIQMLERLHECLESEEEVAGYEENAQRDGATLFLTQHPQILEHYNAAYPDQPIAATPAPTD